MDLWRFTKGDEQESVSVRSWLLTANSHREMILKLALAGEGVVRLLDWSNLDDIASNRLVRVLPEWEPPEAPPVNCCSGPACAASRGCACSWTL
jgi:DNA-binding transcriptional LysR family regulator